jgi:hypothetical protein
MPRQPYDYFPAPPSGYPSRGGGGGTLLDLIMRRGDIAAQSALDSGNIWANAIQGIGQSIGAGLEQRSKEKQLKKRDAAAMRAFSSWDGQDPKSLFDSLTMFNPQDRLEMMKTAVSLRDMSDKADERNKGNFDTVLQGAAKMPYSLFEAAYPFMHGKMAAGAEKFYQIPADQIPGQATPELHEYIKNLSGYKAPEKKTREIKTRNADGSETVEIVADEPGFKRTSAAEPPKRHMVTTPGPGGAPVQRMATEEELAAGVPAYREPKAPRDDRIVQVAGPNGQPIWVREGDAVGKPAAQAPRAVTGAERQSLAYFNRAKEASDDIAPLEEKIAGKNLAGQARLQYAPNVMQSEENQSYRQAQRAFTEARLRKESGAAIPEGEYENDAKTYFAQPGDSKAVLEQKRKARAEVLRGLGFAAGKAYDEFYGAPLETPRTAAKTPAGGGISDSDSALLKKYGY